MDEADPKLQEFLEVMQPASKTKKWPTGPADDDMQEPPTKIQAIEVPEAESDDDYESVPKKARKSSPLKGTPPAVAIPVNIAIEESTQTDEPMPDVAAAAIDDDWLRSRTNRLLDLMDPDDIPATQTGTVDLSNAVPVVESMVEPSPFDEEPLQEVDETLPVEEDEEEKADPILEAISAAQGRLFVRNLPYTATEDDLRKHFEPFGSLEEVCAKKNLFFFLCFLMNIQIGTAYAQACDVNWTIILVDASYFLNANNIF